MNTVKQELNLRVKDMYKQKDWPEYAGFVRIIVDNGTAFPDEEIDLKIFIPKVFNEENQI